MNLFTSDRERRLWLWTIAVLVAIYASLGFAETLVVTLRERNLLRTSACFWVRWSWGESADRSNPGRCPIWSSGRCSAMASAPTAGAPGWILGADKRTELDRCDPGGRSQRSARLGSLRSHHGDGAGRVATAGAVLREWIYLMELAPSSMRQVVATSAFGKVVTYRATRRLGAQR